MTIEPNSLRQMEDLFTQSARGIHLLFDNHTIAKAMKTDEMVAIEDLEQVQTVMTELISRNSIFEKMDYLRDLEPEKLALLVKAYFRLLDSTLVVQKSLMH